MKSNETVYKIKMTPFEWFNSVTLIIIALVLFLGAMWFGGTIVAFNGVSSNIYFGDLKPIVIVSESMTPTIEVNGLLMVEDKPFTEVEKGDIIVVNTDAYGLVIHRVVRKTEYGYLTKGDNNERIDSWLVTEEGYRGCVAEIHNEFAPYITFFFGDLDNLNFGRLLFGFLLIAIIFVLLLLFIKWLYDYLLVYYFIRKSSKVSGENVVKEYYPMIDNGINRKEVIDVFEGLKNKKSKFNNLILRFKILKLHNQLKSYERIRCQLQNTYIDVRKDLK